MPAADVPVPVPVPVSVSTDAATTDAAEPRTTPLPPTDTPTSTATDTATVAGAADDGAQTVMELCPTPAPAPAPAAEPQAEPELEPQPEQKERIDAGPNARLYNLIVRQLIDDGYKDIAQHLAYEARASVQDWLPDQMLARTLRSADSVQMQDEEELEDNVDDDDMMQEDDVQEDNSEVEGQVLDAEAQLEEADGHLIDSAEELFVSTRSHTDDRSEYEEEHRRVAKKLPAYMTRFVTTHKGPCQVAAFSADGEFVATGSADSSIKYLDVDKMHYHTQVKASSAADFDSSRPVLRTFYDHQQAVTDLKFHPIREFLVSCSEDCTIKFFDLSRATSKRAFRHLTEDCSVNSVDFHASGDFLLVGTNQPQIRMYDVNTFQRYCSADTDSHHTKAIVTVQFAKQANYYASASTDGTIKVWDGVSSRCVRTIARAHGGERLHSVAFSANGKYLLSGGGDCVPRLWEVASGRPILAYEGRVHLSQKISVSTVFSFNDDFVLSCDDSAIVAWDTRTGDQVKRLSGHNKSVLALAVSPKEPAFVSCSSDFRARFWACDR